MTSHRLTRALARRIVVRAQLLARPRPASVVEVIGLYPDSPVVPLAEALAIRDARRLAALGLARPKVPEVFAEVSQAGAAGEPAVIDGVPGVWRVDPTQLDRPFSGRTAILSPLDRLVFDRKRAVDLFAFDYQLEMYKPAATRRWGYWAMPVLHGDRLIGKVDARTDREGGVLRVDAIHRDLPWPAAAESGVRRKITDLAGWLGVDLENDDDPAKPASRRA